MSKCFLVKPKLKILFFYFIKCTYYSFTRVHLSRINKNPLINKLSYLHVFLIDLKTNTFYTYLNLKTGYW